MSKVTVQFIIILVTLFLVGCTSSDDTVHKSQHYHKVLVRMQSHESLHWYAVEVENLKEDQLIDIIKEYRDQFGDALIGLDFYLKSRGMKEGEPISVLDVDPDAQYQLTADNPALFIGKNKIEVK